MPNLSGYHWKNELIYQHFITKVGPEASFFSFLFFSLLFFLNVVIRNTYYFNGIYSIFLFSKEECLKQNLPIILTSLKALSRLAKAKFARKIAFDNVETVTDAEMGLNSSFKDFESQRASKKSYRYSWRTFSGYALKHYKGLPEKYVSKAILHLLFVRIIRKRQ